jgi:hypothetical protein
MHYWVDIVERRGKVEIDIRIGYTDDSLLVLWCDLKDVYLEFLIENCDGYGVAFVQTSKVS